MGHGKYPNSAGGGGNWTTSFQADRIKHDFPQVSNNPAGGNVANVSLDKDQRLASGNEDMGHVNYTNNAGGPVQIVYLILSQSLNSLIDMNNFLRMFRSMSCSKIFPSWLWFCLGRRSWMSLCSFLFPCPFFLYIFMFPTRVYDDDGVFYCSQLFVLILYILKTCIFKLFL